MRERLWRLALGKPLFGGERISIPDSVDLALVLSCVAARYDLLRTQRLETEFRTKPPEEKEQIEEELDRIRGLWAALVAETNRRTPEGQRYLRSVILWDSIVIALFVLPWVLIGWMVAAALGLVPEPPKLTWPD